MLDVLSGGRMEIGIGSGYQRQEFDGLGIDMNESRGRFREATEVMRKAWTEDTLTFHGQYTNVDNLWVLQKPCSNLTPRSMWLSAPVPPPSSGPPASAFSRSWVVPPISWARPRRCSRCGVTRWRSSAIRTPISPAHGQGDLCHTDDGRGPARPDWPGRFFLAHSALSGTTGATIGMPTDKDGKLPRGMRPGPRVNRTESGGMILAMPVCAAAAGHARGYY